MNLYKPCVLILFIAVSVVSTDNPALLHYQESVQKILASLQQELLPREAHFYNFKQYGTRPLKSIFLSGDNGSHHTLLQRIHQYKNHLQPAQPQIFVQQPQELQDEIDRYNSNNTNRNREITTVLRNMLS